ncbi:NADP-dependent phosphogluconate dehydrogenase [Buchnera aphidicola]|uniref:NADP-dependent phosphogluconate dehydrogenase n=1 Tax=Buchnera aphidicola TaxID=9 RepID=UPI003463E869
MEKQQIGVVGMAVMGRNLALNISNCNYQVSIFNRSRKKTEEVISKYSKKKLFPYFTIKDFINSLEKPRLILLMIQAGESTDQMISSIIPYLSRGDVLIDGGNAFYKDTIRRYHELYKYGFYFIGTGVSGGEEGALKGPAIMPSGSQESYNLIAPIFNRIAAKAEGEPCVSYIGPDGSGHYVKMVHNGIEYSDMQLISESYVLLKYIMNMNNQDLSHIFSEWNKGELNSYLIEITKNIFMFKDDNGKYLIDLISDEADNKGTGTWTSQSALELNEPLSLITESVFFRYLSSLQSQRIKASNLLSGPKFSSNFINNTDFIENIRRALYLGKIISYAQGFSQLTAASNKYNWNLKYHEIAKIFRSGCIIRAKFLYKIIESYLLDYKIDNLLLTPYFQKIANEYHSSLRLVVSQAVLHGIPVPTLSAAIAYYDSYRNAFLSTNLIQAQRDYFGAHTYKRIDMPGNHHTNWNVKK